MNVKVKREYQISNENCVLMSLSEKLSFHLSNMKYEIRNTLLKKAQSLNIKVDKDYEIVHERMT